MILIKKFTIRERQNRTKTSRIVNKLHMWIMQETSRPRSEVWDSWESLFTEQGCQRSLYHQALIRLLKRRNLNLLQKLRHQIADTRTLRNANKVLLMRKRVNAEYLSLGNATPNTTVLTLSFQSCRFSIFHLLFGDAFW